MSRPLQDYLTSRHTDPVSRAAILSRLRWPAPQDPAMWQQRLPELAAQGLTALALRHAPDGRQFDAVRAELRARAMEDALHTMVMSARTVPVLAELQRRSIPFVVIKGPASARFYEFADDRPYTDIDIIVPGAVFSRARHELSEIGLMSEAAAGSPWPAFDRWCREGVNLFGDDGAAVDLHHHIPPWRWGKYLTFERLRSRAEWLRVGDVDVPVASPAHQLAISALHVLSDCWHRTLPMLAMADIVNIAQVGPHHEIAAELRYLRVDWIIAEIFDALPPGVIPTELRSQLRSTGALRERALMRWLLPPSLPARHPLGFGVRLPARNMIAFALGSVVPSPSYVEERFGSRRAYGVWWAQAGRWGYEAMRGRDVGSPYALDRQ